MNNRYETENARRRNRERSQQDYERLEAEAEERNRGTDRLDWDTRYESGADDLQDSFTRREQSDHNGYGRYRPQPFRLGRRLDLHYERPQYSLAGGGNDSYFQAGGTSTGSSYRGEALFSPGSLYRRDGESGFGRDDERGSFAGRGPKGYRRSDARIQEDVCEALLQHPEIDASDIEVKAENGEVILTGTVSERPFKRMAEFVAEGCAGVQDVRNEIRIKRDNSSWSKT